MVKPNEKHGGQGKSWFKKKNSTAEGQGQRKAKRPRLSPIKSSKPNAARNGTLRPRKGLMKNPSQRNSKWQIQSKRQGTMTGNLLKAQRMESQLDFALAFDAHFFGPGPGTLHCALATRANIDVDAAVGTIWKRHAADLNIEKAICASVLVLALLRRKSIQLLTHLLATLFCQVFDRTLSWHLSVFWNFGLFVLFSLLLYLRENARVSA